MRPAALLGANLAALCAAALLALPAAFAQSNLAAGAGPTPEIAGTPGVQDERPPEYTVGPGDVLRISVWKEPDVSMDNAVVRADGKISLPLVREVHVTGLTVPELEDVLAQRLRRYINNPVVTVIVKQVNSQRVFIIGGVVRPGALPFEPGMTVLRAIGLAGGLTEFARKKKIYVIREANGKRVNIPFDYSAVVKGKNLRQDIRLRAGDTIIVPD